MTTLAKGQNLVPNPSFEDSVHCPHTSTLINYATGWFTLSGNPDYFNPCDIGQLGVPSNFAGYQNAFDGQSYAGAMMQTRPQAANMREHFGIQLTQLLTIGQKYNISFNVSLADDFTKSCWCNKIGAKFTTFYAFGGWTNPSLVNNFSHIHTDSLLKDDINWVTISGSFVADSSYKYIVLGNFYDDAHTDTLNCWNKNVTYVYFDMISVTPDLSTGINNYSNSNNIKVYPNPINDYATLNFSNLNKKIHALIIYDIFGKVIRTINNITSEKVIIEKDTLVNGLYYYVLKSDNEVISNGTLMIE
ncbi:MAG: T9SS type A sorting domain-containing protein [Bacteroidetes bacterium]|nr:T9SS type A sorting domain-containing protein [Bacteroidota bacterium]